MTDQQMDDKVLAYTEFGELTVPLWLLSQWNRHGWPADETIRKMIRLQNKEPADG